MTTGGTTVTRRFSLADSLAATFTAKGEMLIATSASSISVLPPASSGGVLVYSTAGAAPVWAVMDPGEILYQTTAAVTTVLAVPSSGGVLYFSTDATGSAFGPRWAILDAGSMTYGPGTTLAAGSSEQILHISAGVPAWKDSSVFLSTILTAAGDLLIRDGSGITRLAE